MASQNDVTIGLNARNNAGPAIKQVQSELNGLGRAASGAGQGLAGLGGALAGGALFGAALSGVQALGSAVLGLAEGAARLETLRGSFDRLAGGVGQSSAQMLDALRSASAGMISDQDLLLAANKAMLLGVADSAEEMTALMQIAMQRGAAMGLSTSQAFNDIVTGLGRGAAPILDNLGIVIDAEKTNAEYAAGIGKTAAALTEQEKKQALVNSVMREAASISGDAASSMSENARAIGSMGAAWQNLKDQLGTLVSPAVATAMQGLADALNNVNSAMSAPAPTRQDVAAAEADAMRATIAVLEEKGRIEQQLAAERAAAAEQATDAERDYAKEALLAANAVNEMQMAAAGDLWEQEVAGAQATTEAYKVYQAELERTGNASLALAAQKRFELQAFEEANGIVESAVQAYREGERASYGMAAATTDNANAQMEADHAIQGTTQALLDQIAKLNTVGGALAGYTSKLRGMAAQLAGVIGIGGALGALAEEETQIKKNVAAYEAMGWSAEKIALIVETSGNDVAGQWQEIIDAPGKAAAEAEKAARAATKAYEGTASAAESAFDTLTGKVQSVLSLDAGVDAASLLPREDAVNENARRLADIAVNGFKDQDWLGAFAESVPDIFKALQESGDPKGAAAAMLRDFQDGLVPDLIDKDRAKELVKRMITGEQTMAALAQEIAGELSAELGVSMGQAQAAAFSSLGVAKTDKGTTGVGEGAAAELSSEATLKSMAKAGVEAAMTWGTAFLDSVAANVPAALIQMLTTLITPQVQANLAAAQSQQGAK